MVGLIHWISRHGIQILSDLYSGNDAQSPNHIFPAVSRSPWYISEGDAPISEVIGLNR